MISFKVFVVCLLYSASSVLSQSAYVTVDLGEGSIIFDQGVKADSGEFVCVTLDWWPKNKCNYGVCPWTNSSILEVNLESKRLRKLVKSLGNVIIRIGGTQADTIVYEDETSVPCTGFAPTDKPSSFFTGGCLTRKRWEAISKFADETGSKIIFGINARFGREKTFLLPWDASNARNFLSYIHMRNLTNSLSKYTKAWLLRNSYVLVGFEFGNEISSYPAMSSQVAAEGFHQVRNLIDEVFASKQRISGRRLPLYGPDAIIFSGLPNRIKATIDKSSSVLDGITWHSYPLGPGFFEQARTIGDFVSKYSHLKLIMGESGGAFNSGHNETNNRFLDAFWYLHAMGGLSKRKHSMFCRQTLVGGNYELVDKTTHLPNPSYYAAMLFKRVMGRAVLDGTLQNFDDNVEFKGRSPDELSPRDEYFIRSPEGLHGKSVLLNNKPILFDRDGMVHLEPKRVTLTSPVSPLPPQSYAFIHFSKDSRISKSLCGFRASANLNFFPDVELE